MGAHVSHIRVRCFARSVHVRCSSRFFALFSCDLDNQMTDFSFVKRFGSRLIFVERGPPKRVGLKVSPGCRWRQQISWGLTFFLDTSWQFYTRFSTLILLSLNFTFRFGFLVTHLPDTQPFEVDRASGYTCSRFSPGQSFQRFQHASSFLSLFESFQILFSSRVMMAR